jgi:signal transduction histidine kinase
LRIDVEHDVPERVPAAVEVAVYRIVSEALMNVQRHAVATAVEVRLFEEGGSLVLEVADDGVGIGAEASAGVGLQSMRERAAELGGRLDVTGRPSGGTVLRATLPLPIVAREEVPGA